MAVLLLIHQVNLLYIQFKNCQHDVNHPVTVYQSQSYSVFNYKKQKSRRYSHPDNQEPMMTKSLTIDVLIQVD